MKKLFATTVLTLLALTLPASAAEIKLATKRFDGRALITIKGDLKDGDDFVFAMIALKLQDDGAYVVLESRGGEVAVGIAIGEIVHQKAFRTYVGQRRVCASACTYILLAGTRVFVEYQAILGFHQPSVDKGGKETHQWGMYVIADYLRRIGLTEPQIEYMLSAQPSEMRVATLEDALNLGFNVAFVWCSRTRCDPEMCQQRWCLVMPPDPASLRSKR